ncbi:MAG: radical SAM family heme chaperone HemW [Patescibacteria group bacterium]|nr:radical SAM family heme chaperone HemW [Patescibacteria group bacterium]
MPGTTQPSIGLYVHVPFCRSKCAYCAFVSHAGRDAQMPRYVDVVVREIARRAEETEHPRACTAFLGGGTPSLLSASQIARILEALREAFPFDANAEITCECNPGTLTGEFSRALRAGGVNRLSLGAQAFQPRLLGHLGRPHDWRDVVTSVDRARQAGIENINLDLMFGLPSQTVADMRETVEAAVGLSPTHLSCYSLMVEEGTPLARDIEAGTLPLPDEAADRAMYELARRILGEHGYEQYEISNFARKGYACQHNIGCWTRVPYLGFGCAAHSFFGERRSMNPSELDAYLQGGAVEVETISPQNARFESIMLGLRMTRGVHDADFVRMHGMGIRDAFGEQLDAPIRAGLLEWRDGALRLTRLGLDLQDSVLVDLM